MSTQGLNSTTTAAGPPQYYFCHQCNRRVTITPSPSSELTCPICHGGFLEEDENQNPNPNPINPNPFLAFDDDPSFPFPSSGFPLVFSTSSRGFQDPPDLSALFGGSLGGGLGGSGFGSGFGPGSGPGARSGGGFASSNPGEFSPFAFLQNYLNRLQAGGANIQFVIENNTEGGGGGWGGDMGDGFRLPSNLGDYFVGPGLEQLIQQLAENDPNRYGTPPASKKVVEGLPSVKISKEVMESDYSDCAVCKDGFELNEEAKQLPCKHMYHQDCILPWLELHNSCPVCRFELPTDDPDYENRSQEPSGGGGRGLGWGGSVGGGGSQDSATTPRGTERRFRINLPWPFAGLGSSAEASNSGTGSGNGNAGSGNQGSGGQARQEDLD